MEGMKRIVLPFGAIILSLPDNARRLRVARIEKARFPDET
jgi:hypothetical protein